MKTLLIVLVAALACGTPALAQQRPFAEDNHAFRFILEGMDLKPVTDLKDAAADPEHTLLIFMGQTRDLVAVPGGLANFVRKGGALLVATDQRSAPELMNAFRVSVTGHRVHCRTTDPTQLYRFSPNCPVVHGLGDDPPLFQGLDRIAANLPSYLRSASGPLPVLATFPPHCWVLLPSGGAWPSLSPLPFAAGGSFGSGRALILSDHSVFINEMMMQEASDNDNFTFAYNCIQWLTNSGQRNQVWFQYEGAVVPDFDVPVSLPLRLPELTVGFLDRLASAVEDDNLANQILFEHYPPKVLLGALLLVATLLLGVYGLHRMSQAKHDVDSERPAVALASTAGLLRQRQEAMLQLDNVSEAARAVARQCFLGVGYRPALAAAEPTGLPPPHVHARGWRESRALAAAIRRLWTHAYGDAPLRVSRKDLTRLARDAEQVKNAVREGRLQLSEPEGPA